MDKSLLITSCTIDEQLINTKKTTFIEPIKEINENRTMESLSSDSPFIYQSQMDYIEVRPLN